MASHVEFSGVFSFFGLRGHVTSSDVTTDDLFHNLAQTTPTGTPLYEIFVWLLLPNLDEMTPHKLHV